MHPGILTSQSLENLNAQKTNSSSFSSFIDHECILIHASTIFLTADEAVIATKGWGIQENYEETTKSDV